MEESKRLKKKSWLKYCIWSISFLLLIGVGTYIYYQHYFTDSIEGSFVSVEGEAIDQSIEKSKSKEVEGEVDISKIDYDYWHEDRVISTMHEMTHQKVRADQKWGAVEMTEERIDMLNDIVKNSTYHNKDALLKILSKWKEGDFRTADEDHNALWSLQDGNIGKATGILSEEEEQEFIEKTFKTQTDDEGNE
ncbi:DUF6241 domain-containing protein [Niallia sp. Sow4_A1]|jgi:hypothetical protein|uniref:DUF6241 domain-containing protein n=1 Tax=Bacillaceae TaxID=186817 RepID=UPI0004E17398|nr:MULTISPECIES: DUF6241 domain-containing protein [Bacillaceae]MCF2650494.1 hypothetical protein [Niallia circulans]MCM3364750.1 DUF6241 domain-containing protein [Niallia sp. MER TA 168]CAI9391520.1 hypothetical protein BACSP_03032 [Bacillus sp. T2.9-1]